MSELGGTNVTRMSSVLLRLLRQSFLNLKHIISEQKYNFQFVPNSTRKNNPCGKIIIQNIRVGKTGPFGPWSRVIVYCIASFHFGKGTSC
jgi:hypothetical protein